MTSTPSLRTHFLQKREFCQNVHFFGKSAKSDGFETTLKNRQKPVFSGFLDISGFCFRFPEVVVDFLVGFSVVLDGGTSLEREISPKYLDFRGRFAISM